MPASPLHPKHSPALPHPLAADPDTVPATGRDAAALPLAELAPPELAPRSTVPAGERPPRAIRSYVLRAGRMGSGQERALAELGPRFVLPFETRPLDLAQAFGRRAPCVLEIGFGMGAATAAIAAAHPETDYLGVEVHVPGVGALLREIGDRGLTNLRILRHDAVEVLQHMIAPASLAGVHVFFPDPWHKKKHHKRRLVQAPLVALLTSRLAPGGYLHCATDWQPYAEQMLAVMGAEPQLQNTAEAFAPRPDYRPLTKFEARGLRLGHGVWDLVFRRRRADAPGAVPA
jgi:tRNA (guanine-N7-)-methyltransferase